MKATLLALALVAAPLSATADCTGTVYLTFDTGNMAQAEEIARILKEEHVKATFFVANEKTAKGRDALDPAWGDFWRARVAEGHAFGSHTWDHLYLRRDLSSAKTLAVASSGAQRELDERAFCADLTRTGSAFHQLTGAHLQGLWRAPGGRTTQNTIRWAANCGYPVHVGWDAAGFLGDELSSDKYPNEALLKRALKEIKPGTVTLMHLGVWSRHEPLAPILAPMIQGLKARGMCFAPLAVAAR